MVTTIMQPVETGKIIPVPHGQESTVGGISFCFIIN
jgi:hypothetical protein